MVILTNWLQDYFLVLQHTCTRASVKNVLFSYLLTDNLQRKQSQKIMHHLVQTTHRKNVTHSISKKKKKNIKTMVIFTHSVTCPCSLTFLTVSFIHQS